MSDLRTLSVDHSNNEQTVAESSLAIMQTDMTTALKNKQQKDKNSPSIKSEVSAVDDLSESIATIVLDESQLSRVIEMAWEDRTPFSAIEYSYGLDETAVIKLMRRELKPSSFRLWRERVTGRDTKHLAKRSFEVGRAYCQTQYKPR